ncbi:protein kinase-like domain protein [Diplodia corticola]|uniref:Protein kinase-like domain protein n=1 Tax=Diplodia corticola TaxID=236234 RepID=A0A1J9RQF5_9PEZI|nr:protein kinase-like domain protein [Diplodia corticola]OJD30132.1 protein kinase-like domain protein [Diplodia corticola]
MDLSCTLLDAILEPTFVFRSTQILSAEALLYEDCPWEFSPLNPKNRLCSLAQLKAPQSWRIDGGTSYGTRFFTVPTIFRSGWAPLRIDTFIPDQTKHPLALRSVLQSSHSVCTRGSQIGSLGISHHICNALDYHFRKDLQLWDRIQHLPFGSRLVFENVTSDVKDMTLRIIPAYELEMQLLSVQALKALWADDVADDAWPDIIHLDRLVHLRQLHDSITVVRLHGDKEDYVFKSTTSDPKFLYHELKLLLTIPPHPHIVPPPLYIVVKKSSFGGKLGVCGFILPYYSGGSLRDMVPRMALTGSLDLQTKCKWARQIISALTHLHGTTAGFYSDLRPDNILLKCPRSSTSESEDVVLVDFEQRGNWNSWTAPEITSLSYLQELKSAASNAADDNEWLRLLRYAHLLPRDDFEVRHRKYRNQGHGSNTIWFSLSPEAKVSAEVYSLGLLLYCIFEELSNPRNNLATSFDIEPRIEFPEFKLTPHSLRQFVLRCAGQGSSWNATGTGGTSLYRQGDKLVLRHKGQNFPRLPPTKLLGEILELVKQHWEAELGKTEAFLKSLEKEVQLETRPSLQEAMEILDELDC